MVCPRCGLWNAPRRARCESCGEPLHASDPARPNAAATPITTATPLPPAAAGAASAAAFVPPAVIPWQLNTTTATTTADDLDDDDAVWIEVPDDAAALPQAVSPASVAAATPEVPATQAWPEDAGWTAAAATTPATSDPDLEPDPDPDPAADADATRAWELPARRDAAPLPPVPGPAPAPAPAPDATWSEADAFTAARGDTAWMLERGQQQGQAQGWEGAPEAAADAALGGGGGAAAVLVAGLPGFGAQRTAAASAGAGAGAGAVPNGDAPPPERAWDLVYRPIPGPVDRESFFDAQRRYRRQTWRQTLVCALAAIVAGVPLSLILTPFIYFGTGMLAWLVHLVVPVPDRVWDGYRWVGSVMLRIVDEIEARDASSLAPGETVHTGIPWDVILPAAAVWLLPGIVAMLLIWPALRALLRHGGVGGVLLAVAARAPRMDDFEERQLVNVVAEMALAAGLPTPQVALIDAPVANAAAVGTGPRDATILVSRQLLDELDRDETSAVLGHLVASIGNGDLRAALSIVSIFQTFGFASALVRMPASRLARQTVWRVLRLALFRRGRADEAHAVAAMLSRGVLDDAATDDLVAGMELPTEPKPRPGIPLQTVMLLPITAIAWFILATLGGLPGPLVRLGVIALIGLALVICWYQRVYLIWVISTTLKSIKVVVMLPYFLGVFMPQMLLSITVSYVLEPMVALVWRTRRYLADATAVQLTRNPQALAEGLSGLVARGATIPGGTWAGPYFVVGGEVSHAHESAALQAEVDARVAVARSERGIDQLSGAQRRLAEAQLQLEMRSQVVQAHYGSAASAASAAQAATGTDPEATTTGRTATGSAGGNTFSGDIHGVVNLHPPLSKRLKRLRAFGATIDLATPTLQATGGGRRRMGLLWFPVLAVLLLVVVVLMAVLVALLAAISLAATGVLMLAAYGVLAALTPV